MALIQNIFIITENSIEEQWNFLEAESRNKKEHVQKEKNKSDAMIKYNKPHAQRKMAADSYNIIKLPQSENDKRTVRGKFY